MIYCIKKVGDRVLSGAGNLASTMESQGAGDISCEIQRVTAAAPEANVTVAHQSIREDTCSVPCPQPSSFNVLNGNPSFITGQVHPSKPRGTVSFP